MHKQGVIAAAVLVACAASFNSTAQPVRLRLANSLCTSMTSQVLTSQLVPALSSTASREASVNTNMVARAEEQREAFFARLDALKPHNGVYATGSLDHSVPEGRGGRYSIGLEWELYNQGQADSRRQIDRLRLENKTQYLQVQRDLEQRQLQESLLAIEQMRNRLLATLYEREVQAIRPVLERRRQELKVGRITKGDFAEIQFKAERASLRAQHHAGGRDVLVYPQAHELVNRIESLVLRPNEELVELAAARSPEYQLQALLMERSALLPSIEDNKSVRLYVERSKDFERSPQNIAGVRMRIPLGKDVGMSEVAEASRQLYVGQQESLRASLLQRLAMLSERLRLRQHEMRLLQAENRMVRTQAELACYRLDYPVASIPGDPDRDVEELTLRLYELQRDILTARLDVLEVLTQISAIVKPREPKELYSLGSP